jgi:GNAT superfamily N-acetyltransferase
MARTEIEAPLVQLELADVSSATGLSDEAGWNQTPADWALMIRLGEAFGLVDPEEQLVATAVALPYPPRFGWISMVLVHGPFRRRGLATRLLERSIAGLQVRGLVPLLDATPAGQAVYERSGFRPVDAFTRWRGRGGGRPAGLVSPIAQVDPSDLRELDEAAFGADRSAVLADLLAREPVVALRDPAGGGHLLSRAGRTATQVGPVVAQDAETAVRLVEDALAAIPGPVVIDVPDRETAIVDVLRNRGFTAERPFVRMALGRKAAFGDASLVRAIAGPELG